MNTFGTDFTAIDAAAVLSNANGQSPVLLVCEHASNHVPARYNNLGLDQQVLQSHAAWDPGALAVAQNMAQILDARLVSSTVSRLVYDCNRPPESPDAMRAVSEVYTIPGNQNLDKLEKQRRVDQVYTPFRQLLADTITDSPAAPIIVTIHSFAPVYNGEKRQVELGILHDSDARLADAMLELPHDLNTQRNVPYAANDGVTHTLKLHAIPDGYLNVMIEIRNDLIATADDQKTMAQTLATQLERAIPLAQNQQTKETECQQ